MSQRSHSSRSARSARSAKAEHEHKEHTQKEVKVKKTADPVEYQRKYREENREFIIENRRRKQAAKKLLDEELLDLVRQLQSDWAEIKLLFEKYFHEEE